MRLVRAEIKNYRSIADVTISFEQRCRILVGINESGKSNILSALALLDPERTIAPTDIRDFGPDEPQTQPAYVRFVFSLSALERKKVLQLFQAKLNQGVAPVLLRRGKALSSEALLELRSEPVHIISLKSGDRSTVTWRLDSSEFSPAPGWYCAANATNESKIRLADGSVVPVSDGALFHKDVASEMLPEYFRPAKIADIERALDLSFGEVAEDDFPECLFWSYAESSLLPAKIGIEEFAKRPTTCEPLRLMFALAGYSDATRAIRDEQARPPHGVRNLLNRVADRTNKHIKATWKEYKGVQIVLSPNGEWIDASVKDEFTHFPLDRRSDGFKRFVTFLIHVSAKTKTKEIQNFLYLQDEPDIGLHPSGVRFLRDELIRMSESNYVVTSTHSIFLIDKERIERHLIVEKKNEITTANEINASNIRDEEVIYNALNFSLYELLEPRQIIFEGWKDKRLFEVFLNSKNPDAKRLKPMFAGVGSSFSKGVKDLGRVVAFFDANNRKFLIVTDGDQVALENQRRFGRVELWKRYDELNEDMSADTTAEDFIHAETLRRAMSRTKAEFAEVANFPQEFDFQLPRVFARVKDKLIAMAIDLAVAKSILHLWKDIVFDSLTAADLRPSYSVAVQAIADALPPAD